MTRRTGPNTHCRSGRHRWTAETTRWVKTARGAHRTCKLCRSERERNERCADEDSFQVRIVVKNPTTPENIRKTELFAAMPLTVLLAYCEAVLAEAATTYDTI